MRLLKKTLKFLFGRLFWAILMVVLQMALLMFLVLYFSSNSALFVYVIFVMFSVIAMLGIVSRDEVTSYKLLWTIVLLGFPLFGGMFFLVFGRRNMPKRLEMRIANSTVETALNMPDNSLADSKLTTIDAHVAMQSRYIYNASGYPVLEATSGEYFALGDDVYPRILSELAKAEQFIFLEFFIVEPGVFFDSVMEILYEKAANGVEVFFMFDDLGSISTLPRKSIREMRQAGLRLCTFNPIRPRFNILLNCRDHRKVLVVDNRVGFCGGINLADEYINRIERFGHWKDSAVMISGAAVWQLSFMFLQQWAFGTGQDLDFSKYRLSHRPVPSDGYVQAFADSPLDTVNVTETAYSNIIARATKYVYITTPYLVISYEMECALCAAASSGVDVRIFTPHIYDKWYVHLLTRSHYDKLIRNGVKIYEYTPGFIHSKMFVADDIICMVGTCNMDYRSFYLHYECGIAFYSSGIVQKVKQDMLYTQSLSQRMELGEAEKIGVFTRLVRVLLKVFAPLM